MLILSAMHTAMCVDVVVYMRNEGTNVKIQQFNARIRGEFTRTIKRH